MSRATIRNMKVHIFLAAAALAMSSTPILAQTPSPLVCTPTEKHACSMGAACVDTVPGGWINIDAVARTYERCGPPGPCDRYDATFTVSGQTVNVEIPGRAAFLKLMPGGGYAEVVSAGTVIVVSYGYCRPQS